MSAQVLWVWLATRPGIGALAGKQVLDAFGTPEAVYAADRATLTGHCRLRKAQIDALCEKDTTDAVSILRDCEKKQISIITMDDAVYPDRLRAIADPPLVLYVRGRMPDFDVTPGIAVVGTRQATPYGESVAEGIGRSLAEAGLITVSGMAKGNDGAAQRGALRGGGKTVAVLAGGVDICYPMQHQALMGDILLSGAVISEQPPSTEHRGELFPVRNRIISGLCVATVVVEAGDLRSGSMITARHALDQGRDVYAVPGGLNAARSAGCNQLIERGEAEILTSPLVLVRAYKGLMRFQPDEQRVRDAFLKQVGVQPKPYEKNVWDDIEKREKAAKQQPKVAPQPQATPTAKPLPDTLSAEEKQIVTLVQQGAGTPTDIMERSDLPAAQVMALITMLEMDGILMRRDGRLFLQN